jgi:DNA-directed RNA polymerase sigma subunit (sigma70/sigma32)
MIYLSGDPINEYGLDARELLILRMRAGTAIQCHGKPMTLKAIGRLLGITRERVRQIEKVAKKKFIDTI